MYFSQTNNKKRTLKCLFEEYPYVFNFFRLLEFSGKETQLSEPNLNLLFVLKAEKFYFHMDFPCLSPSLMLFMIYLNTLPYTCYQVLWI